jgi:MFS family permease
VASNGAASGIIPRYSWYALGVILAANTLNYLDRSILHILAPAIIEDMQLDDAQMGFLMGTAFAIFYAVVGIAMGRIADALQRTRVMAVGLAIWSAMTAFGGMSSSFAMLGAARMGVGIGESTATPCGQALIAEYFPPKKRATALSINMTGSFIGTAGAMIIGGLFLEHWDSWCGGIGACGVKSWQAALFAVGLPGLPLALIVWWLREPGVSGSDLPASSVLLREFAAAVPPFTLVTVFGLGGRKALLNNLALVAGCVLVAAGLILLTGDTAQWASVALGAYAIVTWGQVQSYRDAPLFKLTFGDRSFLLTAFGAAAIACIGGGVSSWAATFAMRTYQLSPLTTGVNLGLLHAITATIGVIFGGWMADRIKPRDKRAPIYVAAASAILGLPFLALMVLSRDLTLFYVGFVLYAFSSSLWGGTYAALAQDLVLPRMRSAAAACFSLVAIIVASGAGPYWAGRISKATGSLSTGMMSMQLLLIVILPLLWFTAKSLKGESPERRLDIARAAGENHV